MDILADLSMGFSVAFSPMNLLFCAIGVFVGTAIGVLPALGPTATIALLLPFTYGLEPAAAIIMLAGIFLGAQYGGSICSILLNIPGEASAVVACLDGYPLTVQGRAGTALGLSALVSYFGGAVSVIGLMFLAPAMAGVAIRFGPPEYVAVLTLGLLMVAKNRARRT